MLQQSASWFFYSLFHLFIIYNLHLAVTHYSIVLSFLLLLMWWCAFCWGTKGVAKYLWIPEIFVTLWFRYWRYSPLSCNNWNSVWFKGPWKSDPNTCRASTRKLCPTCPSWLLAKWIPDTGQSCISNLDHSSEDGFWSHVCRVFLRNKADLKEVGCSTPLHLISCLTYLLDYLFLSKDVHI